VRYQAFGKPGSIDPSQVADNSPINLYRVDAPPRLNAEGTTGNPFLRFNPPPSEARREQAQTSEMPMLALDRLGGSNEQSLQKAEYKRLMNTAIGDFANECQSTDCKVTHAFPENATQITMTRPDFSSKVLERYTDGTVTVTEKCPKGHPRTVTQLSEDGWQQTQIAYEKNAQGRELPWKASELVSTSDGVSKELVYKYGALKEVRDAPYKPLTA
jgi:hypothetical protein